MQKTIFIVEDDPSYQKFYNKVLGKEYKVVSFYDGQEALDELKKSRPDLLIVDMNIPSKTGRDIIIEYKKIDNTVPIIVVTSKEGIQTDPEIKIAKQVCHFLKKPINFFSLAETVKAIFEKQQLEKRIKPKVVWEGQKIAGCKLEKAIGAGAAGTVYQATRFGDPVAVKILKIFDEQDFARYKVEIMSMAKVQHPNIVELLDAGSTIDNSCYVVMRLFNGSSVEALLQEEGALPTKEAIFITKEIASGMKFVHGKKIIHRDLKPSNVLYNRESKQVKIIDFGISKEIQGEQITQMGKVLGTPLYMSPEQCSGEEIDNRSDIYNLGVFFYHLLVGKTPFENDSIYYTMISHLQDPIEWPPHKKQTIPKEIKDIVERMMAKKREDRFQRMVDVEIKLEDYIGSV